MIGETVSHYRILAKLGGGGMGVVYEAEDTRLHRRVALKFLPDDAVPDPAALQRFRREAEAASALNHPHICTIYDVGERDGRPFIVMEKLEGETLATLIGARPMPIERILTIGSEIAEGLAAAHGAGIIHRDIKPANIFITKRGDAKLLDFGLARLEASDVSAAPDSATDVQPENLTRPGTTLGTVAYMSPEQTRGQTVDARSDLFSLGAVLYEMSTGVRPFRGTTSGMISDAIVNSEVRPPSELNAEVPRELDQVILNALEKDRELRVQSAAELRAALLRLRRDTSSAKSVVAVRPKSKMAWPYVVALLLIVAVVVGIVVTRQPGTTGANAVAVPKQRMMIAVLPFENMSGDAAQEYFTDGLTEDTTTEFGRVSPDRLGVIARSSAMRYKKARADVRAIGRELGVDYLVEGSVRRSGDRVRVAAQLVRATDGTQIWAETYDRTVSDVLAMQSELARDVASAVQVKVVPSRVTSRSLISPVTEKGRDALLRARYLLRLGTPADRRKAIEYMQEAAAADPNSALVNTELARALYSQSTIDLSPNEVVPKARAAVERALQLDDKVPEAHEILGRMLLEYYWNWPEAERELKRAIALDPNLSSAHLTYAELLVTTGRTADGLVEAALARQLDPFSVTEGPHALYLLHGARQWDLLIEEARKAIRLAPNNDFAYGLLALGYFERGDRKAALETADRVVAMNGGHFSRAMAAYVYAGAGRPDAARSMLQQLHAAAEKRFVCFFNVASVHHALGEDDQALASLNRAFDTRTG